MRAMIVAAVMCSAFIASVPGNAQSAVRKMTAIQAQPLAPALQALVKERQFQIVYSSELLVNRETHGAKGELTMDEALGQLLEGTGLTYNYIDSKTVSILLVVSRSSSLSGGAENGASDVHDELRIARADVPPPSSASAEGAPKGTDEEGKNDISEIIVTAQRREQALQDVPVAVTAFGREELQQRGAQDLRDVMNSVPGLSATGTDRGTAFYSIRGLRALGGRDRTTGIYYDDVSVLGNGGIYDFDPIFFDLDRVEVLRGPQGTLFGGSAMGGAIRYVSARPDTSEFSLGLANGVSTTRYGSPSYNGEAVLNLPLVENVLALRIGARSLHEGGYIDNVPGLTIEDISASSEPAPVYVPLVRPSLSTAGREDYNSSDTLAVRASLLWQPDASLSIRPSIFYQEGVLDNPGASFTHSGIPELTASYRYTSQPTRDEAVIYSLDVQKDFGGVTLSSLTALFERDYVWDRDYSFFVGGVLYAPYVQGFIPSVYEFNSFADYPTTMSVFSQELRLSSDSDADDRFSWALGLFYSSSEDAGDGTVYVNGAPAPFGGYILQGDTFGEVKNRAAFADATFALTDRLDISAGVRLFEIEQFRFDHSQGPVAGPNFDRGSEEDGVNPRINISYALSDDQMVYASAAKGFRPGGPLGGQFTSTGVSCDADLARLGFTTVPTQYEADSVWSYELGSKNEFAGGRRVLNAAVYQIDWDDIQQQVALPACGNALEVNAGAARLRGVELETRYAFENALELGASISFTDAEITDPGPFSIFDAGDAVQGVPDWIAAVFGEYTADIGANWLMRLRANYEYRGEYSLPEFVNTVTFSDGVQQVVEVPTPIQDAYDVAGASVAFEREDLTVRLFVNNVFDNRPIFEETLFNSHSSKATTLRPRTIGVEVRYSF